MASRTFSLKHVGTFTDDGVPGHETGANERADEAAVERVPDNAVVAGAAGGGGSRRRRGRPSAPAAPSLCFVVGLGAVRQNRVFDYEAFTQQ